MVVGVTSHCVGRFFERFGDDEDLAASLARSVPVSYGRACRLSAGTEIRSHRTYRLDAELGALFAVDEWGTARTVVFTNRRAFRG